MKGKEEERRRHKGVAREEAPTRRVAQKRETGRGQSRKVARELNHAQKVKRDALVNADGVGAPTHTEEEENTRVRSTAALKNGQSNQNKRGGVGLDATHPSHVQTSRRGGGVYTNPGEGDDQLAHGERGVITIRHQSKEDGAAQLQDVNRPNEEPRRRL